MLTGDVDVMVRVLILLSIRTYRYVLFVRIILSWIPFSPPPALRPAFSFLYDLTEPFLRIFRRLMPSVGVGGMGLDLSPLIGFVVLWILEAIAIQVLFS